MKFGTMKKSWLNQIIKGAEQTFTKYEIMLLKSAFKHFKPMTVRPVLTGNHWLDTKMLGITDHRLKNVGLAKTIKVNGKTLTAPTSSFKFKPQLAPVVNKIIQDKAGRSNSKATTSHQGIKVFKNSVLPWNGSKIELTSAYYLSLLFAIGMKLIDNDKSEKILVLKEAIQFIDPHTGKLNEQDIIGALRKKLTKEDSHKGRDEFIELKNNVLAYNNPAKYGYFVKIGIDATAQMWSLYASVILRSKALAGRTNLLPESNNFTLNKTDDFNTEALNIFIKVAKLEGKEAELVRKYGREAIKKWIMPPGYGAGAQSSFRMSAKHADTHPELLPILERFFNDAFHEEFLEALIPGFFKFSDYMKSHANTGGTGDDEQDQKLGRDEKYWRLSAKLNGWMDKRVTYMDLGGLHRVLGHTYIKENKVIADFQGIQPYLSEYVQDDQDYKGDNGYRLFMVANTAHTLDAWLVRFVKNDMMDKYGVALLTNHDAYYVHPEYLFAAMNSYVNGLKTLVQLHGEKLIEYMVNQWTNGEGSVEEFVINDFDIQAFINTPNELLFNLIWG